MKKRTNKSRNYERMSVRGGYRMALLRNHGHISASALITTMGGTSSRQAIVPWLC